MISLDGGQPRPLLFDGSPLLPSAVCAQASGHLLVGRDALHLGLAEPGAFEPHPKRCVDDGTMLLGVHEYRIDRVFAAVLARVLAEADQVGAGPPDSLTLTYPAVWSEQRQAVLRSAAAQRGQLVSEPVAAANYFTTVAGHRIAPGAAALVYDLGAGTFDASVVRRTDDGFEVLASRGRSDAGGLDIDAAIVAHLRAGMVGAEQWSRLERPTTAGDRRARVQLWDGVRRGKEMLSRSTATLIHVPVFDVEVPLGREVLDQLTVPILDRTVDTTREVLAEAGIGADQLVAIFTTGGGARLPMVSTVLHRAFGLVPTIAAQPELVVAEGALYDSRREPPTMVSAPPHQAALGSTLVGAGAGQPSGVPTWPGPATPIAVPRAAASGRSPRARTGWLAAAALLVLFVASATVFAIVNSQKADRDRESGSETAKSIAGMVSPSASYPPGIDPCLLGAWRSVSSEQQVEVENGDVLVFVGPGGTVVDFRADKTVTYNYSATKPNTAKHKSVEWTVILRGTLTDHYEVRGGRIFSDTIRSDATSTLNRNGQFYNVVTIEGDSVSTEYICSGDTLIITAADSYSSRLQRVTSTDAHPVPSGSPST